MTTQFDSKNNYLDIPNDTLVLQGEPFPARVSQGKILYRWHPNPESVGIWEVAPSWVQEYYQNTRKEVHSDQCRNCGNDIRMMVMNGTGFCSMNCKEEHGLEHKDSSLISA